ncbi:DUF4032 domain-containing protein [Actinomadura madurae]|nr:DUF4032 domain-containing protein [Actinomadura madurae]URM97041.1 DUF4032 domain-containing protein [Actinomadura madurae]
MHFVFTPPGESAAGLLDLPWTVPLAEWDDARLVEIRQRGLSRHTVRFVAEGGAVYALKELDARLARREYRLLRELRSLGLPAVEVIGVVVDRPDQDAILVTRFLDHSSSYRALFANARYAHPTDRLLDALVELLVRLHLAGFMWGDCSLSNVLFRLDAGAFAAYLVDAETAELHPSLSEGQRDYDVSLARERIAGELFDLAAAGTLPDDVDPIDVADDTVRRYQGLWDELTREEILHPAEQRYRIAERLRRINSLGFDVDEVELVDVRSTEGASGGVGVVPLGRPAGGGAAARAHARRRAWPPPAHPHGPHRAGRAGEPGAAAAQRHRRLPRPSRTPARRPGAGGRGVEPVARRGVRTRHQSDPAGSARPPGRRRAVPRGPRTPLVPVGEVGPGRRHVDGGPGLLRVRAAGRPPGPDRERPSS